MYRIGGKAASRGLRALVVLLALSAALGVASIGVADEPSVGFRIIVHAQNPARAVERELLADAFLKKAIRWPDGEAIQVVDQRIDAPARQRFSERVLRRSVFAVRAYWQQRIFSGRGVPPPELESDEAVVRFVARHRGAVGYVSERANTGSARVVTLLP